MKQIPHELDLGGIYLPPVLVATFIGLFLAIVVARFLNKYHLAKYFANPPLAFIAFIVIFTMLAGFIIPF